MSSEITEIFYDPFEEICSKCGEAGHLDVKAQKVAGAANLQQQQRNENVRPYPTCVYDSGVMKTINSQSPHCPDHIATKADIFNNIFGPNFTLSTRKVGLGQLLRLTGDDKATFRDNTIELVVYVRNAAIKTKVFINFYILKQLEYDNSPIHTPTGRPQGGNLTATGGVECEGYMQVNGDINSHGPIWVYLFTTDEVAAAGNFNIGGYINM
ncbi:hypothetical protein BC941DRAFT_448552 [Chlamydoabsidia padenii]|nr:hypothetical protein BC941DRAFT_448552 [Chlamydoabsidia padenii]